MPGTLPRRLRLRRRTDAKVAKYRSPTKLPVFVDHPIELVDLLLGHFALAHELDLAVLGHEQQHELVVAIAQIPCLAQNPVGIGIDRCAGLFTFLRIIARTIEFGSIGASFRFTMPKP